MYIVNTFICNLGQKTKSENAFRTKLVKHVIVPQSVLIQLDPKTAE